MRESVVKLLSKDVEAAADVELNFIIKRRLFVKM